MSYELADKMTRNLLFLFVVQLNEIFRQWMKEVNHWVRLRDVRWQMNHRLQDKLFQSDMFLIGLNVFEVRPS